MFFSRNKDKSTSLKQKKTYAYMRVIVGVYLCFTGYNMMKDLRAGIPCDNPTLVMIMAGVFGIGGLIIAITAFIRSFQITALQLNEEDKMEGTKDEKISG